MYTLLYTICSIGVVSLCWYICVIAKKLAHHLHIIKLIDEGNISLEELEAENNTPDDFKFLIENLVPNQQVYAGICLANVVSMVIMVFAMYIYVYCAYLLVFYTCFLAFGGAIYNINMYYRYEDSMEMSFEKYISILSIKDRLFLGATFYSVIILLLLTLI